MGTNKRALSDSVTARNEDISLFLRIPWIGMLKLQRPSRGYPLERGPYSNLHWWALHPRGSYPALIVEFILLA